MDEWTDAGHSLGGYRCASLGLRGELTLAEERGEIWELGPGMYKAYIIRPTKSEKLIQFSSKDLPKWILRLKVPSNPVEQAFFANSRF